MKLSLYNIEQNYLSIVETLIENGGELTPELETELQITKQDLETKGVCYGFIVRQLECENEIIDGEIERLNKLKKSRSNSIDKLKKNIAGAMQLFDVLELKTPLLKINFRSSESVEIEDIKLLDSNFIKTTVSQTADKTAIKEAIKSGLSIQGATLKQNKNIQIK